MSKGKIKFIFMMLFFIVSMLAIYLSEPSSRSIIKHVAFVACLATLNIVGYIEGYLIATNREK